MMREFQAVYRMRMSAEAAYGVPQTFNMIAANKTAVEEALNSSDCKVLSVTEVRPIVDWEKPAWDLDEFAAAIGIRGATLSGKKSDGITPWSSALKCVPRRVALKFIEDRLNPAGKKIVEELDRAA